MIDGQLVEAEFSPFVKASVDLMILKTLKQKVKLAYRESKTADWGVGQNTQHFSFHFVADVRPSVCDQQNTGQNTVTNCCYT